LEKCFVGAEGEGTPASGYIKLLAVKRKYYERRRRELRELVGERLRGFDDAFRKELYTKLYAFFHRYFDECGSMFFTHTPFKEQIYERVYADHEDVELFWKTRKLIWCKDEPRCYFDGLRLF
jgi:hypothetical protein